MLDIRTIIGWLMVVGAVHTTLWALYKSWQGMASKTWPSVMGRVSSIDVAGRSCGEGDGTEFMARVRYVYEVQGNQFENAEGNHTFVEQWGSKEEAQRNAERYRGRDEVRVFYNPRKPATSVLETRVAATILWALPVALAIAVAGLHLAGAIRIDRLLGV